jgi:hypothetical protein
MANARQLFDSDEDERQKRAAPGNAPDDKVDQLRKITGMGAGDEHTMEKNAGKGLFNPNGDNKPSVVGGASRLGGTDKTGKTATGASFQPAKKVAAAAAPEAAAATSGAEKLRQVFAGNKKRKRNSMVATVIITLILIIGFGIGSILPDELIALMSSLERHFFAKVEYDLDKESSEEVSRYIAKRGLKELGPDCKSTKDECFKNRKSTDGNEDTADQDPIEGKGGLYDEMDKYDFFGKLSDQGYDFSWDEGKVFIENDGLPDGKLDITDVLNDDNANLFDHISSVDGAAGEAFQTAVTNVLPTEGSYLHDTFTKLIVSLFGGRFCDADCDPGDEDQDRAKLTEPEEAKFSEEVDSADATAVATTEAETVECLATTCSTDRTSPNGDAATDPDPVPSSPFEQAVSEQLAELPPIDVSNLATDESSFEALEGKSAVAAAGDAVETALGDTAADVTTEASSELVDKFSPVGWIQAAAQIIAFLGTAAFKLAAFNFLVHAVAAIHQFMPAAAGADEQKAGGNVPQINILGSMVNSLHARGSNAEASPYVQMAVDPADHPEDTNSKVHSYLDARGETFDDNNNPIYDSSTALNKIPLFNYLTDLATLITRIINDVLTPITFIIEKLFQVTGIDDLLAKAIPALVQAIASNFYHLPNLTALGGEDKGTLIAEGVGESGSKAGDALGGEVLTPAQSSALTDAQENIENQQFMQQPLFARMFNENDPQSFVSQLALNLPAGSMGDLVRTSFASLLNNPFGKLFGGLAVVLQPPHAFAADPAQPDPAGIPSIALPIDDPVFSQDPETYWQENDCAQQSAQDYPNWNAKVIVDQQNGQTEHTTTNGCLMIQRSAQATGDVAGSGG